MHRIVFHARSIVVATLFAGAQLSFAAEELINASQDRLLAAVEQVLLAQEITILEQAQTDRFALIYALQENGSHVTITVRQLPADPDRARIRIQSDNPAHPNLDRNLLSALAAAIDAG